MERVSSLEGGRWIVTALLPHDQKVLGGGFFQSGGVMWKKENQVTEYIHRHLTVVRVVSLIS